MKNMRIEWLRYLNEFNFQYFLTVTFCRNSPNSDKDIDRFIRIVHQQLFGKNFLETKRLLGIAVVRERPKYTAERNHYHILIEEKDGMNLENLASAICNASTKCRTIKNIREEDYEKILINYDKPGERENNATIKLAEIKTEDRQRVINYVLKDGKDNDYINIHFATEKNHKSYFPIITV